MRNRSGWKRAHSTDSDCARDAQMRNALCFLLFVFLCVAVALFTSTFPNHRCNRELLARSVHLEREKAVLAERNGHLRREIAALNSDPFYIEAVARRKFKLIRPGELLIEPVDTNQP